MLKYYHPDNLFISFHYFHLKKTKDLENIIVL